MIPNGEIKKALLEGAIALQSVTEIQVKCGHDDCEKLVLMVALESCLRTLMAISTLIGNGGACINDLDFAYEAFNNLRKSASNMVKH